MIQKACNVLIPHASANLALYSGAARVVGLSSLDELAFKAVLAVFSKVYGGLWVGGRLTLDHEQLWVRQNLVNRLAHTDDYSQRVPLEEILRAEWTFGVVTCIVVVPTVHGTLKLRGFGHSSASRRSAIGRGRCAWPGHSIGADMNLCTGHLAFKPRLAREMACSVA